MARGFVSVLIDTYNHERFIERAIVSVLEQDFPGSEREIIVIDDGSADRTPKIVKKFEAEISSLYAEHEIFVLPSLLEEMPLVVLEAMASEMPVITTESSGMTDLIEDSHDGLFVIPGDADTLALAITKVCLDGEQRLGSAAQEKMKRYTWSACARRQEMVFNRARGFNADSAAAAKPETSITDDLRVAP